MVVPKLTGTRYAGSTAAARAAAAAAGRDTYPAPPCVVCGCTERLVAGRRCPRCPRPTTRAQRTTRRGAARSTVRARELEPEDVPLAFELWQDGMPFAEIGRKFEVSRWRVAAALYAEEERRYMERISRETG